MRTTDYVVVQTREGRLSRHDVSGGLLRIGRLPENDLVLDDARVSRKHARIHRRSDGLCLVDLGSTTGSFVNGRRVNGPTPLRTGDTIQLGETTLYFNSEPSAPVAMTDEPLTVGPGTVILHAEDELHTGQRSLGRIPRVVYEADRELVVRRPLNELFSTIMDLAWREVEFERGFLMLLEDGKLVPREVRLPPEEEGQPIPLSQTIVDRVLKQHESILTSDALSDTRFRDRPSVGRHGIRSLMCVPLWNNHEVIGFIYVDRRSLPNLFSEENLQVLTHLASVAAVKIENARLVEEAASAKALESELRRAREIQTHLLPPGAPAIPGYLVVGRSEPCQAVGGDYYDYLEKSDGRYAITIGDVAGKGLSAALLMHYFQASLVAVSEVDLSPEETIGRLHALLSRRFPLDRFVTCFYGILNPAEHSLSYVNAGHNPPLLLSRAGQLECLHATGRPLGIFAKDRHESRSVRFEPGDTLICYSDGVPDSCSPSGEWFGEERLVTLARQAQDAPLSEVVEGVFDEVEKHRGGGVQEDDLTLVVLRRGL